MTPGVWAGRRVLLTGHTGFKGAWLARWLTRAGAHVTGFALPPDPGPTLFALLGDGALGDSRIGDLRDREAVQAAARTAAPDIVFPAQAVQRGR